MKFIVVTGGSVSGLGKGTTISSLGVVLKCMGYRVTAIKIDPYLNIDAGTMSPFEHGEVFVLHDGGEVDLDLGNYERALNVTLERDHNLTSGKVYEKILKQERRGDFLGKTVQMVPHVTDCIKNWLLTVSQRSSDGLEGPCDICLVEVGGTTGDIEASVYFEALQQLYTQLGSVDFCLCHLTYLPTIGGEQKTKPSQQSVRALREAGLKPDFVFCRVDKPLERSAAEKISLFCQVPVDHVVSLHNVPNIYCIVKVLSDHQCGAKMAKQLALQAKPRPLSLQLSSKLPVLTMEMWDEFSRRAQNLDNPVSPVRIGIVGKYTGFSDAYLSVLRALEHAACESNLPLKITWIESTDLEEHDDDVHHLSQTKAIRALSEQDGILCPGGFGVRGINGIVFASQYARQHNIPYFGICLGLQTGVIDICRNILGVTDASSEEWVPDGDAANHAVIFMPETANQVQMGGTMRLGSRETRIVCQDSLSYSLYDKQNSIIERHRHRYEVNPAFVERIESTGFKFVGKDLEGLRMEILEGPPSLTFYVATQFHPEFTSSPLRPNPCFLGFVLAAAGSLQDRLERNDGSLLSGVGYTHATTKFPPSPSGGDFNPGPPESQDSILTVVSTASSTHKEASNNANNNTHNIETVRSDSLKGKQKINESTTATQPSQYMRFTSNSECSTTFSVVAIGEQENSFPLNVDTTNTQSFP